MTTAIEDVIERIVNKQIDKQEAKEQFDALSEAEKNQLLSKLSLTLGSEEDSSSAEDEPETAQTPMLKPALERSLSEQHLACIERWAEQFGKFAAKSKELAMQAQYFFVDQRKTGGLKKPLKSLQYHITYHKGEGAYLYDVDGNKYVDITGDNGVNLFGQQPQFIKDAIDDRMHRGYPLVGYTEELFKAARLFTDLTKHDRVLFTQSGTEAVMWACRIARAFNRKKKIVTFDGAYHGLSDTVLAFKGPGGISMSGGLGTLQEFAEELIVLDWNDMSTLEQIEKHADEIAGVLVEPVQSRAPQIQPAEFLRELRKLTLEKDIVLIFDEMITGFRAGADGCQGMWGIKADIATYGKIPGGGMPTGMIAGMKKYMDFVDGGTWELGDDSMPSLKRTLMAGTHTRNPLKIAATLATLSEIKRRNDEDPENFYPALNGKTAHLATSLNDFFNEKRVPIVIDYFTSLFRFRFLDDANGVVRELLFVLLRMNGVETSVSGNFFINTEHTDEDISVVIEAVKSAVNTLIENGFYTEPEIEEVAEVSAPVAAAQEATAQTKAPAEDQVTGAQLDQLKQLILNDLKQFQQGGN